MNKKIIIPIVFSSFFVSVFAFNKNSKICVADDSIVFDVDKIQALSHANGVTVNMLPNDINAYWNASSTDLETLRNHYEMNDDISSFANNANNRNYVRDLYANWDDFKPTNNVLTWKSNVKATSYNVSVSLTADFTNAVYEQTGLTEPCYTMVNPYANTHYFWQVTAETKEGSVKSQIFDFYSGDYKRTVDIPTVSNTRDVGGFTSIYGTMKQGLIYRSGRIDDILSEGKSALNSLNIQTDLDLRKKGEGLQNPANLNNYYLTPIQQYSPGFNATNRESLINAVKVFTEPNNYPIMFHCAVGRDRTGTLAMLLQSLAGASKEYIIHDYYTSMWSVTGAYQKSLSDLNLGIVNETLATIESFGTSLSTGAENFLKKDSKNIGLTSDEIQMIRDIWSGKVQAPNELKPFKAALNYEGKAYVNIKALGHKDVAMMVNKGTVVSAPYELSSSFGWYTKDGIFSFANPINDTTYIYADYLQSYYVTIHFIGLDKEDVVLIKNSGDVINFAAYEVEGYNMLIISDTGKEITKLEVTRDVFVNVLYLK